MAYVYDTAVYDTATYDSFTVGGPVVELLLGAVWTDITTYVRIEQGILIQRGRQDWSQAPTYASCSLTLDNRDGRFSPRNASGAFYGSIGRNTQIRVSVFLDDGTTTVRFWGDVSEWPVAWDPTGRNVWVSIQASGVRRRLDQTLVPLRSAYKDAMLTTATGVVGYWPMEDGSQATQFASALTGGQASGTMVAFTPAADDATFVASAPIAEMGDGATVQMFVPAYTTLGCATVRALLKVTGSGSGLVCRIDTSGAHYFLFEYAPASNAIALAMYSYQTGAQEYLRNGVWGTTDFTVGCRFSIELRQNGTGIDTNIVTYPPGTSAGWQAGVLTIPASTLFSVTSVTWFADTLATGVTASIGHTSVQNTAVVPSIFDLGTSAVVAFKGETAADRWVRVGTAQGIPTTVVGGLGTCLMGPQGIMTALGVLDEAAYADDAVSSEIVDGYGLKFRARSDMYDSTISPVWTYILNQFEDVRPVDDDQFLVNDVTVVRTNGGSARVVDTTSAVSTANVGTYAAEYDLNLYADSQCLDQAGWRLTEGTVNKPRLSALVFDAYSQSGPQRIAIAAMREGDTTGIFSCPAFSGLDTTLAQFRVLGWSETIGYREWVFSLNCVDANPFNQVLILDSASYGLLDTDRLAM